MFEKIDKQIDIIEKQKKALNFFEELFNLVEIIEANPILKKILDIEKEKKNNDGKKIELTKEKFIFSAYT